MVGGTEEKGGPVTGLGRDGEPEEGQGAAAEGGRDGEVLADIVF